jgi:hypothetical protein
MEIKILDSRLGFSDGGRVARRTAGESPALQSGADEPMTK